MFDISDLPQQELKNLAAQAISRIENPEEGIGNDLFEAIIAVAPQAAVELVVVDNTDGPTRILLIWRDDEHYLGWHFPGGYPRFGQDLDTAVRAVAERELEAEIRRLERRPKGDYSRVDSRGHTFGLVFLVELDGDPTGGEWFDHVPEDLLPHHKELLRKVLGWE